MQYSLNVINVFSPIPVVMQKIKIIYFLCDGCVYLDVSSIQFYMQFKNCFLVTFSPGIILNATGRFPLILHYSVC